MGIHFFLVPLPLLALGAHWGTGSTMYWDAVKNLFLAELLTNAHGFVAVVTNHAGDDMYRFMHGFLNYQIEHHLWPNLSMLSYQRSQPLVKALCKDYGVPYVQENVFLRVKKTVDIMTGATSMKWFPADYERKFLDRDAVLEAEKKERK